VLLTAVPTPCSKPHIVSLLCVRESTFELPSVCFTLLVHMPCGRTFVYTLLDGWSVDLMHRRTLTSASNYAQLSTAGGGLWRQGSMNLPAPEDSGVPPDNPDSCILRIRRNHLIEVRTQSPAGGVNCAWGGLLHGSGGSGNDASCRGWRCLKINTPLGMLWLHPHRGHGRMDCSSACGPCCFCCRAELLLRCQPE
jgi:hypothetical protein